MAEQTEAGGKEAAAPKRGGSKLAPVLIGVNSLALIGVLAFVLLRNGGGARGGGEEGSGKAIAGEHGGAPSEGGERRPVGKKKASGPDDMPGPTLRLPDFVVHLRNSDADRYARMSFEVEVDSEEDKTKLTALLPAIRDNFISFLSDRTIEEMRGSEAIARTKQALAGRLQQVAPNVGVRALYLTDLVIQ